MSWVEQRVAAPEAHDRGRLFDLFTPEGRYLGTLRLPFELAGSMPEPIVRDGVLHGVTGDELGGGIRGAGQDREAGGFLRGERTRRLKRVNCAEEAWPRSLRHPSARNPASTSTG